MNNIQKTVQLSDLFRIYQDLLTEKQKEYFSLYIDEDLSLSEIALEFNISKTAVHDSINKTTKLLFDLELKLKIHSNQLKINKLITKIENNSLTNDQIIKELKEVI